MKLISPKGKKITCALDIIEAGAKIKKATVKNGRLDITWEGSTEVFWDTSKPMKSKGERLFMDEDFDLWTETEVVKASTKKNRK
jgi:hypothetical protein